MTVTQGKTHHALPRVPAAEPEEFGRRLIETGDLDPVYVALKGAQLAHDQLCRWLIAYWLLYHAGAASSLSEDVGLTYWRRLREAAASPGNDPWPRNVERRHFRGQKAVNAVDVLSARAPHHYIEALIVAGPAQAGVMAAAQGMPLFGPWIAFKAADMLEVLGLVKVRFDPALPLIYEEPRKGLEWLADRRKAPAEHVFTALQMYFSNIEVPWGGRMCGVQEVETVLCKWKSHAKGSQQAYWVGHDIAGLRRDLVGWGNTADKLLACCPASVDDGTRPSPIGPPPQIGMPAKFDGVWDEAQRERQRQQALQQRAGTYVKKGDRV